MTILRTFSILPGKIPVRLAERVKAFYEIIEDNKIDQETLKAIVLQALPPGVSEWMNAWCEDGGKRLPISEWLGKIETDIKRHEGPPVTELWTQLKQWKT